MHNFMLALITAVEKDQTTMQNQQMTDATSTEKMAKIEYNIYQHWQGILEADAGNVEYWAGKGTSDKDENAVKSCQAQYNEDSSEAHSNESQMDGVVQDGQQQTSSDASNLQMKAQMVQAINSIQSTLSGLLGRITA